LTKRTRERRQRRKDWIREKRGQGPLAPEEKGKTVIGRFLTQDVLYLMVVNMPTQEEMNHALALARGEE